jgi:hypothetical protein
MRAFAQVAAAAVLAARLCGTAHPQSIDCQGGQKLQQMAELIFGRGIRARGLGVSDNDWMLFVDDEITPRFPDGLTVFEAAGQWRDRTSNKIFRERSRIALIILPGDAQDLARLSEITDAYKRRFRQQSVVVIVRPACVSF